MAVRKVLQATDPQGEAVLRRRSNKVKTFDHALQRLADDLLETMHAHNGVGLAAVQVGVLQRVIVVELPPEREENEEEGAPRRPGQHFVLCNPEGTWLSEEEQVGEEGCLSLAGWYAEVPRAQEVEVRYQDLQGKRRKLRAEGYLARALQHEMDHLEGILFTDQIEDLSTLVRTTRAGEQEAIPLDQVPEARRTRTPV
jgi:peptide deformylase